MLPIRDGGGQGAEPDQVAGAGEGGASVPCAQAGVRPREGLLPRAGQECQPSVRGVWAGQSVYGPTAVVATGAGVVRPQFAAVPAMRGTWRANGPLHNPKSAV